jgi:UDP-N-acetylmuramate-alanine ligase
LRKAEEAARKLEFQAMVLEDRLAKENKENEEAKKKQKADEEADRIMMLAVTAAEEEERKKAEEATKEEAEKRAREKKISEKSKEIESLAKEVRMEIDRNAVFLGGKKGALESPGSVNSFTRCSSKEIATEEAKPRH